MGKIVENRDELISIRKNLRSQNKKVVFTNGCFDILHAGHTDYLNKAKAFGDFLILGLNSDISVKNIKGDLRPIVPQRERAILLSNLLAVDFVSFFDEDTPLNIITDLIPDYLVKGADWDIENVVGREIVEKNGGEVKTIPFVHNSSTTDIIDTIINRYCQT